MGFVAGTAVLVAGALCVLWSGFAIAARLLGDSPRWVRWTGALTAAMWLLTAVFAILATAHAFTLPAAIAAWILVTAVVSVACGARTALGQLNEDLRAAGRALTAEVRHPIAWPIVAGMAMMLLRLARGFVIPPITHDALMYHLVKAGRWVQESGYYFNEAPGCWRYYDAFPHGGSIPWAWAMLPVHTDDYIGLASWLVWLLVPASAFGVARGLGAEFGRALLAAFAIGLIPAAGAAATSALADNTLLAYFLLGAAQLIWAARSGSRGAMVLAAGALGLAAGVKTTGVPLLGFGILAMAFMLWRARVPIAQGARLALGAAASAAVGLPSYIQNWVWYGSPLYPFLVAPGGRTLFEGNDEFVQVLSGRIIAGFEQNWRSHLDAFVPDLIWRSGAFEAEHINLGPAGAVLVVLGICGLAAGFLPAPSAKPARAKQRKHAGPAEPPRVEIPRVALVFLLVSALFVLEQLFFSEMLRTQLVLFSFLVGRLITPAIAALILPAVLLRTRVVDTILSAAITIQAVYAFPDGMGRQDGAALLELAPVLAGMLISGAAIAFFLSRKGWSALALALSCFVLVPASPSVRGTRITHRYEIYKATLWNDEGGLYDYHRLGAYSSQMWSAWQYLDNGAPKTIAITVGWSELLGHQGIRYPLLGRSLENRVIYVPITNDGSVIDYRLSKEVHDKRDFRAWAARLLELNVDFVFCLHPSITWERQWMSEHPDLFPQRIAGSADGPYGSIVNRPALQEFLDMQPAGAAEGGT